MKLNKSTTILVNIVFILVIAFLVKGLITIPKDAFANAKTEYWFMQGSQIDVEWIAKQLKLGDDDPLALDELVNEVLNQANKDGWKLHSCVINTLRPQYFIFER